MYISITLCVKCANMVCFSTSMYISVTYHFTVLSRSVGVQRGRESPEMWWTR